MSFIFYADLLDGNGLQVLYDSQHPTENAMILGPKAKLELNKAYTAEFSLLPNHYLYSSIKKMTTLIYIVQHGRLLFRGRVIDIIPDFYRQKKITCESDIAFLLDSILPKNLQQNVTDISTKIERILKMVDGYEYFQTEYVPISWYDPVDSYKRFNVGNVTVTSDQTFPFQDDSKMQVAKDYLFNELLPYYGGILQTRTEDFGTANEAHYIDYLKDPSQDDGDPISQPIRFGVNLINFTEQNPVSSLYTRLIPTGQDGMTIENVLPNRKIYISNPELEAIYGIIYRVESWSDIGYTQNLLDAATKYNNDHAKVFPNDLSVKAIDLKILDDSQEEIKIGDKVLAFSRPHEINRVMCCKAIDYDFMNPENNTYSIGTFVSSIDYKKATHGAKKFNYSGSSTEEESLTEQTARGEKVNQYHSSRVDSIDDNIYNTAGKVNIVEVPDGQGGTVSVLSIAQSAPG